MYNGLRYRKCVQCLFFPLFKNRERQNGTRKCSKKKVSKLNVKNRYGCGRGDIYQVESTRKVEDISGRRSNVNERRMELHNLSSVQCQLLDYRVPSRKFKNVAGQRLLVVLKGCD